MNQQQGAAASGLRSQPDLDDLARKMAGALAALDCPDCCGPVYEFIEIGATIHHEELEWACVLHVMRQRLRAG